MPPPSAAAFAEKQGGGTTFLFGRKKWQKRWFVVNVAERAIAYWETQAQQESDALPLKPPFDLKGASVDVPAVHTTEGGVEKWPFEIRFPPNGEKTQILLRSGERDAACLPFRACSPISVCTRPPPC